MLRVGNDQIKIRFIISCVEKYAPVQASVAGVPYKNGLQFLFLYINMEIINIEQSLEIMSKCSGNNYGQVLSTEVSTATSSMAGHARWYTR